MILQLISGIALIACGALLFLAARKIKKMSYRNDSGQDK